MQFGWLCVCVDLSMLLLAAKCLMTTGGLSAAVLNDRKTRIGQMNMVLSIRAYLSLTLQWPCICAEKETMLCILYFDKRALSELKCSISLSLSLTSICIGFIWHTQCQRSEFSSGCTTSASYSQFNALKVKSVLMLEKYFNTLIPTWERFLGRCVWQARRHIF